MRSTISEKNIISDLFEWFNQFINRLTNYLLIIGSVIKKVGLLFFVISQKLSFISLSPVLSRLNSHSSIICTYSSLSCVLATIMFQF